MDGNLAIKYATWHQTSPLVLIRFKQISSYDHRWDNLSTIGPEKRLPILQTRFPNAIQRIELIAFCFIWFIFAIKPGSKLHQCWFSQILGAEETSRYRNDMATLGAKLSTIHLQSRMTETNTAMYR